MPFVFIVLNELENYEKIRRTNSDIVNKRIIILGLVLPYSVKRRKTFRIIIIIRK